MIELQNAILEMIAKGDALDGTIERLCREVERILPEAICSVLTVDGQGCLQTLAAPSLSAAYVAAVEGLAAEPDAGACGRAVYIRRDVEAHDIATDPRWAAFRDLVLEQGLRACWSNPVFDSHGHAVATFALYFRQPRGPTAYEREIVERCVNLCTIALDRHRRLLEDERRANIDFLTGLSNRAAFNGALARLDCNAPGSWAICLLDIDNLKVVNDTFGHHAGDALITHVADRLAHAAHPAPAYRIGGDEFAVILRAAESLGDLEGTGSAFLEAIAPPVDCGGNVIGPRATIGLAVVAAGDRTPERVRQNADLALYHAKETGRGGIVRYWPGIGTRMTRRLAAIREVDCALSEDRVEVRYQPVVQLGSGKIVGVEALCRMRVDQSLVAAASFHEATTDAHIAVALTERMMTLVAADVRRWIDMGIAFGHVGINVSSADFHSGAIYPMLVRAFESRSVPLRHVVLEVTESVYMAEGAGVVQRSVAALRAKGVRVALDDFGTGYTSLTHLVSVPVDYIKIDKSFVDRITTHEPSLAVVEGMIWIARKLGIEVVAEGIETEEQARKLAALGSALGQGYHYCAAVSSAEVATMMMPRTTEVMRALA